MLDAPLKKCPKCKKMSLKRLVGSGAGLIFKGTGFYITDYKNAGAKADAAKADSPKSEAPKSDAPKSDAAKTDSSAKSSGASEKPAAKTSSKPAK